MKINLGFADSPAYKKTKTIFHKLNDSTMFIHPSDFGVISASRAFVAQPVELSTKVFLMLF
jgi:hypothetical protein